MLKNLFFLFVIISSSVSFGALDDYHKLSRLGEIEQESYSGPLDPSKYFDRYDGTFKLEDHYYRNEKYYWDSLDESLFDLSRFGTAQLSAAWQCPEFYIRKHVGYMLYLHRLQTISYLFESMKHIHHVGYYLGVRPRECAVSKNLFKNCSPKSLDMKKFLRRIQSISYELYQKYYDRSWSQEVRKDWLNKLESKSFKQEADLVGYRLQHFKGSGDLESKMNHLCKSDADLIQVVCSETDQLYGTSYLSEMVPLLSSSNAIKLINDSGLATQCLERFQVLFKRREKEYSTLIPIFAFMKKHLLKSDTSYPQGDLFLPGALKEFDLLGLNDFIFATPTPTATAYAVLATPTPEPTTVKIIAQPTPVLVAKSTPTPKPIATVAKISELESAVLKANELKKPIWVNMSKFGSDFIYSVKAQKRMHVAVKEYQTRRALEDMKRIDHLGTTKQPLSLFFFKFMIDYSYHQGLFNMQSILGEQFYIVNDLESKKEPILIEIINNQETRFKWQLIVHPSE